MKLSFFFHYTATTEICTYCNTLSLHDALPIFAGFAVEGVEAHLLAVAGGRRQRHRAGDERQLQVACPVGARRHLGASSGSATPVNARGWRWFRGDRKSTRLNSSH